MTTFTIKEKQLLQEYETLSKRGVLRALNKRLRSLDHYDHENRHLIEALMDKLDQITEKEYDKMDFDFDFYDPDYDPSISEDYREDDEFSYSMYHDDEYDEGEFDPEFSDYI